MWLIDQVGWFENNIEGKIRDERMVELWHNKIVGVEALPRKYPRIYTIFKQKKCISVIKTQTQVRQSILYFGH